MVDKKRIIGQRWAEEEERHKGPLTQRKLNKLTLDPGHLRLDLSEGFRGSGTVDVGESPTNAMIHSMPDFSSSTGKTWARSRFHESI
jgi:hypothetical protein